MKKEKDKKVINIVLNVLIVLFTIAVVVLTVQLVRIFLSYAESRKEYNELREEYVFIDDTQKEESGETPENSDELAGEDETEENKEPACDISVDFKSLWKINPDIKGWIYMDAVDISYPIVQGEDNDEYLFTSVKGTSNNGGSIFMDSLNGDDFSDPHTLIYGHNMKDGSMFGNLKKLYNQKTIDDLDTTLCFWIITPEGKYRYDVFSIHTVDASGDTYTLFSGEGEAVGAYMNKMARLTGVELPQRVYNSKDKVITLSTCTGSDYYRLVVQGVLHLD